MELCVSESEEHFGLLIHAGRCVNAMLMLMFSFSL